MTDRAVETIQALRTGHDALAARVRGLSTEELARPSAASEWDVSQVLSHLGSGAEISQAALERALDGAAAPDQEFLQSVWARWDAMSRTDRAAGFLTANESLVRRYEGLDERTRNDLRVDLGFLPEPVDLAGATGLRLSEFTHHAWDVAVVFEPGTPLAPEAVPLLFAPSAGLIGFIGRADALEDRPVTIAVNTTAPERSFGLAVGESVSLADAPGHPDAVLTAPAEWWLRLVAGRHAPEHTPDTVRLTGGTLTLDDLRRVFPGF
jgi:uncharacterized protein (TIGR03083 family)